MNDGPYARISLLQPHDGHTVDFEAGYTRHLEWHRQAKDPWSWFGWTVWAGDRQRWLVYATFGHSAAEFDSPVDPAGDERDNVINVVPHSHFAGSAMYEFLPAISRGEATPSAVPRVEMTTVELIAGTEPTFEAALAAEKPSLQGETLWYRMVCGGNAPRYVRLRPRRKLSELLDTQALPGKVNTLTNRIVIEILNLRPPMCYGVTPL